MLEALIWIGFAYCVADFVLGVALGRCVLPGLKCRACKEAERHG